MKHSLRREVNVRERLPRDVRRILYVAAWLMAAFSTWMDINHATGHRFFGIDSHAYWSAFLSPLYTSGPMTVDEYLYSPVFAQVLWPLAQLPWPVFFAIFSIGDALVLVWLLRPLGWRWVLPLVIALSQEIFSGNVFVIMAAAAVLGFRYPGTWALSALTKVTPTMGPVWWLVRREWRQLLGSLVTTAAIALPSIIAAPHLWEQWWNMLVRYASDASHPLGTPYAPALVYRLPVGLALVAWGARTNRRWTLPAAMVLAAPVFWFGAYAMLAAIPRLQLARPGGGDVDGVNRGRLSESLPA